MKVEENQEDSESFFVGGILAVVGGFLDAYTYLTRGGVFANAQTGNIAMLGISVANGDIFAIGHYIVPITAFAVGVLLAQCIRKVFEHNQFFHWRRLILLIEIMILFAVAFIPSGVVDILVNVAISFVCALQCETFRKVQGNTLATTMCTGNLRIAMEMMFGFLTKKDVNSLVKCGQYLCVITFFVIGAYFGGVGVKYLGATASILPAILLCAIFLISKRERCK